MDADPTSDPSCDPTREPGAAGHDELVLTGERTLPGIADERYWFVRHEVAYLAVAADLVRPGDRVLDAGCGEGYGLALLADAGASRVVGVDLDPLTVAHARRRYAEADPRIEVHVAEFGALPLEPASVDVTVSLQVIEHVWDVPGYLAVLAQVTRPGGRGAIATPNRLTFTPDSDTPVNPFHVTEFAPDELVAALEAAGLAVERLLGLHHTGEVARLEAAHGLDLPRLLGEVAPDDWPAHVRAQVHATSTSDFHLHERGLTDSLDLLALCRVPAP
ncbi:MAG: class I SAM-dependent methyltransferase [Nitriliruptoraceae bacterium]|nr:class I SAM-dependent methyltransferase [Nitriliruptoraceae bacterium]